jgi:PKD repeat protein
LKKNYIQLFHLVFVLSFALIFTSASAQWTPTTGPYGGTVNTMVVSGTNIFAGTTNGVFLSGNNGTSWTAVNTGFPFGFSSILSLAVSGTNIFASTGAGGIFMSGNNGTNWTAVNTGIPNTNVNSLTVSGTNIFAGTNSGIFISGNNGTSWTAVNTGLTNLYVNSIALSGTNIFAGTGGGVYLSVNNGTSWTAVNTGLPANTNVVSLAVSGTNIFAGANYGGVFLSVNNGTSWTAVNTGLTNLYVQTLAVSGTNIFAGTYNGGVFLSANNGTSWTAVNTGLKNMDVKSLTVNGTNIFAGTNGAGIFLTVNNGTSWSAVNTNLTALFINSFALSGTNMFVGTSYGVFLSGNNGTSWSAVSTGLTNTTVNSLAVSGSNIFAGTTGGVFVSSNNGTSWTAVSTGLTNQSVNSIAISGANIFAGTNGGGVFLSVNNGTSWTAVNTGLTNNYVNTIFVNGTNIFVGTGGGGAFLSGNNGTSWTPVNTGLSYVYVYAFAVSGTNIYAGTSSGGVFLSANNGANWTDISAGISCSCGVQSLALSGSNIIVGTNSGIFLSGNNGANWTAVSGGLKDNNVKSLVINGNTQFAGSSQVYSANMLFANATKTDGLCYGSGSATVTASGGTSPYTYSWVPSGGTAATATGLTPGTYTATVTDFNANTRTASVTIIQPALLAATTTTTNVNCYGGTGKATATPTGGTSPYTYSWAPSGGTAATTTTLPAGTYNVTVTDANACTKTVSATITQPSSALNASASTANVKCFGGTGTATALPFGGTFPYMYSWTPSGGTSVTTSPLPAGFYNVSITDAKGCTTATTATITQPPAALAVTTNTANANCYGGTGTATASPTGGTSPYTYSWSPTGGIAATTTAIVAGTYTVTVTDNNACKTTANATITQPTAALGATTTTINANCFGGTGTATATSTGGTSPYIYSWAPSGGTAATTTAITAGTYTVTVSDANACTISATAIITQPAASLAATTTATNTNCYGGTGIITANPSGGTTPYTYSWSPSGGTAATTTALAAGTYTVTLTDSKGCTTSVTASIFQPAAALAVSTTNTNANCYGDNSTASANSSGGTSPYSFSWSPTGGTAATTIAIPAGTYTVNVKDFNGCTKTATVTITQPPILAATNTITNVSCNGGNNGSASATVTGGKGSYTYSWNTSPVQTSPTATGLIAGSYLLTVKDSNACTSFAKAYVTEPLPILATVTANGPVTICQGNNVILTASAGASYSWSNGVTTNKIMVTSSGSYTVKVSDAGGCSNTSQPLVVTVKPAPFSNFSFTNSPANSTVSFNIPAVAQIGYYWDFGDNSYATAASPTHTYSIAGGYMVSLKAMDSTLTYCQNAQNKFITAGTGGCTTAVDFSFTQDTTAKTVTFTDKTLGNNLKWYWDFGNGESSSIQNPVGYKYLKGGAYTVCLTARDTLQKCQNIMCHELKANNVADCQTKFLFFTDGSSNKVQFDGKSLNTANSYYWSFGNGEYSNQANPLYAYPVAGYYNVCLSTRDSILLGCQSKFCDFIHAGSGDCKAKFNALPVVASLSVNFNDASVGNATAWYWDLGDGHVSHLQNPTYKYASTGYYKVCLTVSRNGCQDSYCNTIHVGNSDCKTSFSYFTDPVKQNAEYKDLSLSTPTTWSWEFGDGATSTLQNPQHIFTNSGIYTSCLSTLNAAGCISHFCEDILVGPMGIDCQAAFETFAQNDTATFKNKSTGTANTWFWDFGDQSFSALQSPTHIYTSDGYYMVTLTMYNSAGGCFNTAYNWVTIGAGAPAKDCEGKFSHIVNVVNNTVIFKDESFGNPVSWLWNFSDSTTSTLQNPTHTFKGPGFYQACLTIKSSNGTSNVYCNEIGIGQIGLGVNFLYRENATYFFKNTALYPISFYGSSYGKPSKWKWAFGDNSFDSLRINLIHNYANPGAYNTCLTVSDPISKMSNKYCKTVKVATITGIAQNHTPSVALIVYPNPMANQGIVSYFVEQNADVQLSLYDLHGRSLKVFANGIQQGFINQAIDISDVKLTSGMYLMHLTLDGKVYMKPFIVTR